MLKFNEGEKKLSLMVERTSGLQSKAAREVLTIGLLYIIICVHTCIVHKIRRT